MKSPLLGGAGDYRVRNLSYNRLINLYPEIVKGQDGKEIGALIKVPGKRPIGSVGTGPVRGFYINRQNQLFAVSGDGFYNLSQTDGIYSGDLLMRLATSTGPVTFQENENGQIQILDGANINVWDVKTQTSSVVSDWPGIPVSNSGLSGGKPGVFGAYQDGYAVVPVSGTNYLYSSPENEFRYYGNGNAAFGGNLTNALAYTNVSSTSDPVVAVIELHDTLWVFKRRVIQVWWMTGSTNTNTLPTFPFQQVPGVQVQMGCAAPASIARSADSLIWLGLDYDKGGAIVYMTNGYQAVPVSHEGLSEEWSSYSKLTDAFAFTFEHDGHYFYQITFPTADKTWVLDIRNQLWHERASWNEKTGEYHADTSSCHVYYGNWNIVGSAIDSSLYQLDPFYYQNGQDLLRWLRTFRALPPKNNSMEPVRFDYLYIDRQTGIRIPDKQVPSGLNDGNMVEWKDKIMLRWSDDGGWSWSAQRLMTRNEAGQTGTRAIFRRLGSTKRGRGMDRMWEVCGHGPVPTALISAETGASPA